MASGIWLAGYQFGTPALEDIYNNYEKYLSREEIIYWLLPIFRFFILIVKAFMGGMAILVLLSICRLWRQQWLLLLLSAKQQNCENLFGRLV